MRPSAMTTQLNPTLAPAYFSGSRSSIDDLFGTKRKRTGRQIPAGTATVSPKSCPLVPEKALDSEVPSKRAEIGYWS